MVLKSILPQALGLFDEFFWRKKILLVVCHFCPVSTVYSVPIFPGYPFRPVSLKYGEIQPDFAV